MTGESLTAAAPAKINLALVVGPQRGDGKHEVATLLQRVELADTVTVRRSTAIAVAGFPYDTLVRRALEVLEARTGVILSATIEKRIPMAAGLGGGSSDAATALRLGNELLGEPLQANELHELAAGLGSDVPFFLADGPQLGVGDGSELAAQSLPQAFTVLLALAHGAAKASTAEVYAAFDEKESAAGFEERRRALLTGLLALDVAADLARLPRNDLASSALSERLEERGAFRADVSGAGPVVYGLFEDSAAATAAALALASEAEVWVTGPRWER